MGIWESSSCMQAERAVDVHLLSSDGYRQLTPAVSRSWSVSCGCGLDFWRGFSGCHGFRSFRSRTR